MLSRNQIDGLKQIFLFCFSLFFFSFFHAAEQHQHCWVCHCDLPVIPAELGLDEKIGEEVRGRRGEGAKRWGPKR